MMTKNNGPLMRPRASISPTNKPEEIWYSIRAASRGVAEVAANREDGLVFSSDYYHQIYGKNQPNDDEKQRTADAATGVGPKDD